MNGRRRMPLSNHRREEQMTRVSPDDGPERHADNADCAADDWKA